jgi:hypothetical protein
MPATDLIGVMRRCRVRLVTTAILELRLKLRAECRAPVVQVLLAILQLRE